MEENKNSKASPKPDPQLDIPSEANTRKHINFIEEEEKGLKHYNEARDRAREEVKERREEWQEGLEEGSEEQSRDRDSILRNGENPPRKEDVAGVP